ncbi:ABC transporter permease [Pontivivens insulae]|uniref:Glutathione transport system permease protein GsiD n=1 Tax=Pontivivens insulae TaxID=1639689 RepID=A0A2R8AAR6_9RHOB|nr:ABC transporter permease [Pontivivens insulae]RED13048.1 peptide/nickel transport system permease protein [Pontivivens insulae]SPF29140.1 Glutathione transport system permease protein GsiD [Pontivivens insulae]
MEPLGFGAIFAQAFVELWLVWLVLAALMGTSFVLRKRLGLYGQLYDSWVGMVGLALVFFWVITALLADYVLPFDPQQQFASMKRAVPGAFTPEGQVMLFGGDNLGRDVFSRLLKGSQTVLAIAPAATLFAFMVGITLGLPAGFYGKIIDTVLTFLANLVLAFPVILLFYLLVTPGIRDTPIPTTMAAILFFFPIAFFFLFFYSRYKTRPDVLWMQLLAVAVVGGWMYMGLAFNSDPLGILAMDPNTLNIFVSVVFVNSPTVFRIVRGLTMDIKTRDYVAAAQTRGERPWYIMLWEILPNARGPLIVDLCLRIGYTTILLGTLGFFGLGVSPESPDWGLSISEGRKIWRSVEHVALPPALALMSLVLGLNLLADSLREQSLKD